MKTVFMYALAVLVTGLLVGGGTYYGVTYSQRGQIDDLNTQIAALHSSEDALNKKIELVLPAAIMAAAACQSDNLLPALTDGSGTAGRYYYSLALKNTGTANCTYSGSSTIALLDANGSSLGSVKSVTSAPIVLGVGKSVYAAVGFANSSNYASSTGCATGVTTLSVTAPSQTVAVKIVEIDLLKPGYTDHYCSSFSVGAFSLTKPSLTP